MAMINTIIKITRDSLTIEITISNKNRVDLSITNKINNNAISLTRIEVVTVTNMLTQTLDFRPKRDIVKICIRVTQINTSIKKIV